MFLFRQDAYAGARWLFGVMSDICQFDKKAKFSNSLNGCKSYQIPRLLVDIAKVNQTEASIRAVVTPGSVVDHEDDEDHDDHDDHEDHDDTLLNSSSYSSGDDKEVMVSHFADLFARTGGYPDVATREFQHILSRYRAFKTVAFLYISDANEHRQGQAGDVRNGPNIALMNQGGNGYHRVGREGLSQDENMFDHGRIVIATTRTSKTSHSAVDRGKSQALSSGRSH
ncbi:hypothetical protein ABEF95_016213 [Exophiala dermatitidis]